MLYVCYVYKKDHHFVITCKCPFSVFLVHHLKIRAESFRVGKIMIIQMLYSDTYVKENLVSLI